MFKTARILLFLFTSLSISAQDTQLKKDFNCNRFPKEQLSKEAVEVVVLDIVSSSLFLCSGVQLGSFFRNQFFVTKLSPLIFLGEIGKLKKENEKLVITGVVSFLSAFICQMRKRFLIEKIDKRMISKNN